MMEKGSITESMDSDLIQTEQSGKFSLRKQQAGWALKDEKWGGVGQKQWEGEHCRQSSTSAQGLKAEWACLRVKGKASVDVVQWVRERAPQDEVSVSAIFGTIMLCNKQAQTSLVCNNVSIAHVSGELSISSKFCSVSLILQHPSPDRFSWKMAKAQICVEACDIHWHVGSKLSSHHFISQSKSCGWVQSQRGKVLQNYMVKGLSTLWDGELGPFFFKLPQLERQMDKSQFN